MDANLQELRNNIKGHILAIREEVSKVGFDASYISMASFDRYENGTKIDAAFITNGFHENRDETLDFFYDFEEDLK